MNEATALRMIHWFRKNARYLPWRQDIDPYRVWVSEIMLQQTQVKTVIPYYERWMKLFPTVTALAEATPESVLKAWEGLGYYSRARNMQRAAQEIVHHRGGLFPDTLPELLELPGVGPYTAGAIGSIAFNQPTPILDGNVERVLTRLLGIQENPREAKIRQQLWKTAEALVSAANNLPNAGKRRLCGAFNESLMELGALVCLPRTPLCVTCPLKVECIAFKNGLVDVIPALPKRQESAKRYFEAFCVEKMGKILMVQRPSRMVNGQFWELPNQEVRSKRSLESIAKALQISTEHILSVAEVKHTITRFRITLQVYELGKVPVLPLFQASRPIPISDLEHLPVVNAHRKALKLLFP
ncbi:MAG: A/G-specific adenine glycosylase [Verrucomicrobiota bacterium]|nr:A/G-specific adenine glycosylase [Verrucomicrobiota bacterium]